MNHVAAFLASVTLLTAFWGITGCGGDPPRVVEETAEYSFDEMAEMAAAETQQSASEE